MMAACVCTLSHAEVNWQFTLGGMARKAYALNSESKKIQPILSLGLNLQIPVAQRWFIETGLNYRIAPYIPYDSDGNLYITWTQDMNHYLSLPVLAGYRLPLDEKNSFEFAVGPYADFDFNSERIEDYSNYLNNRYNHDIYDTGRWGVGIMAQAAFRHRAMSFGLKYMNPVFLNQSKNMNKSTFMVTIGINFKLGGIHVDWDRVADVLSMTGEALNSFTTSYYEAAGGSSESSVSSGYSGNDSYQSASSRSSSGAGSVSSRKSGSPSELNAYNQDRNSYSKEETLVIKLYNQGGGSEMKAAQLRMKRIREKWIKRGYDFNKSQWEDR